MMKISDVMKHKAERNKSRFYGYLIDPLAQRITRMEFNGGGSRDNLDTMYKAIGCELVEPVYLNEQRDAVFVDEEGLLKPQNCFFYIEGFHQPLAGRGIVVGCDEEGETVSPTVTLDWLRERVAFVQLIAPGITAINAPQHLASKVREFFA